MPPSSRCRRSIRASVSTGWPRSTTSPAGTAGRPPIPAPRAAASHRPLAPARPDHPGDRLRDILDLARADRGDHAQRDHALRVRPGAHRVRGDPPLADAQSHERGKLHATRLLCLRLGASQSGATLDRGIPETGPFGSGGREHSAQRGANARSRLPNPSRRHAHSGSKVDADRSTGRGKVLRSGFVRACVSALHQPREDHRA